ncbi:hypothetical protein E1B28_002220 [Marasmius oreades]|uniref:Uncharacterized protein n=1 Tax=Marasmius oreades TaxID=181124 RepID=A0A9P7UMV9_9AGAR|nr:uncharacterized protein E1B28_002220 [Marasmius oreades]KAG7086251.1 hypothetical protein E1B28_002220 [Marasmius oreades]
MGPSSAIPRRDRQEGEEEGYHSESIESTSHFPPTDSDIVRAEDIPPQNDFDPRMKSQIYQDALPSGSWRVRLKEPESSFEKTLQLEADANTKSGTWFEGVMVPTKLKWVYERPQDDCTGWTPEDSDDDDDDDDEKCKCPYCGCAMPRKSRSDDEHI